MSPAGSTSTEQAAIDFRVDNITNSDQNLMATDDNHGCSGGRIGVALDCGSDALLATPCQQASPIKASWPGSGSPTGVESVGVQQWIPFQRRDSHSFLGRRIDELGDCMTTDTSGSAIQSHVPGIGRQVRPQVAKARQGLLPQALADLPTLLDAAKGAWKSYVLVVLVLAVGLAGTAAGGMMTLLYKDINNALVAKNVSGYWGFWISYTGVGASLSFSAPWWPHTSRVSSRSTGAAG